MVKHPPANAGDARDTCLILGLGRFPWSRKWQYTPVFLPEKPHEQRSLASYSPRCCKELNTTEHTHSNYSDVDAHTHTHTHALMLMRMCITITIHPTPVALSQHFPQQISLISVCLFEFILKKIVRVILLKIKSGCIPFY